MKDKIIAVVDIVVDLHNADVSGLHIDLRIGYPSNKKLLMSWAIPRAVIPGKGAKVLAVETKPHGMKWLTFQGTIEKGYGKGTVKLLQRSKANIYFWSDSEIVFEVRSGKPLNGKYSLIKFSKVKNKNQNAWLLIKMND